MKRVIFGFLLILEFVVLGIVSVTAVVVSAADIFNLFEMELPDKIVDISYSKAILLLLGLLAIYMVVTRLNQLTRLNELTEKITLLPNQLERMGETAIDIRVEDFEDSEQIEEYLASRIRTAQEVSDLTWKKHVSADLGRRKRKKSHGKYDHSVKIASREANYREIFIFNDPRRIEKLQRRISESNDGYSCKYYENDELVPRFQFCVIDKKEVVIFRTNSSSPQCVIHGAGVANVFQSYFEEVWNEAQDIKVAGKINQVNFDKILSQSRRST